MAPARSQLPDAIEVRDALWLVSLSHPWPQAELAALAGPPNPHSAIRCGSKGGHTRGCSTDNLQAHSRALGNTGPQAVKCHALAA